MLRKLRVQVSNEQRLVWAELLQWCNLLFIFCVVVEIAMASGLWVVSSGLKPFLRGHNSNVLPALLLTSGVLTVGLSAVGYVGSLHIASQYADERFFAIKQLMWFELLGFLLAIFSCVLGITSFTIVHGDILWAAERGVRAELLQYSTSAEVKLRLDNLQTKFRCCGVNGYRDWFTVPWQKYTSKGQDNLEDSVPWSCCSPKSSRPCIHFLVTQNVQHKAYSYPRDITLYTQGCVESITKYLGHHMFYICGGLMVFIGLTLLSISMWSRLLETSVTNSYTIGDPECTTWGYFIVNFGPDIEDLYAPIEPESEYSSYGSSSYYSTDEYSDETEETDEPSASAMSSETERVLDVTGPGTPAGKEDGLLSEILEAQGTSTAGATGTMEAATVSETPTSSATLSSSAPDNNNNRIKEGRRRVSNKNNNKKPKKQTIHYSVITPKSLDYSKFKGPQPQMPETHHIPLPPPLPAEDDMVSGMPPLPPPPFQ